jgi:hypothetical protein
LKIIEGAGFPYRIKTKLPGDKGEFIISYIHAEAQGNNIFVSKELLKSIKEKLEREKDITEFEGFTNLHRDHTAVYSSSDPDHVPPCNGRTEHKKEVIK